MALSRHDQKQPSAWLQDAHQLRLLEGGKEQGGKIKVLILDRNMRQIRHEKPCAAPLGGQADHLAGKIKAPDVQTRNRAECCGVIAFAAADIQQSARLPFELSDQRVPERRIVAPAQKVAPEAGRFLAVAHRIGGLMAQKKVNITFLCQIKAVPAFTLQRPFRKKQRVSADRTAQGRGGFVHGVRSSFSSYSSRTRNSRRSSSPSTK